MTAVAEYIEVAYLEAHGLRPEVEIVAVDGWGIGHDEREDCCGDEDVAAGCVATDGLSGGVEYLWKAGGVVLTCHCLGLMVMNGTILVIK